MIRHRREPLPVQTNAINLIRCTGSAASEARTAWRRPIAVGDSDRVGCRRLWQRREVAASLQPVLPEMQQPVSTVLQLEAKEDLLLLEWVHLQLGPELPP